MVGSASYELNFHKLLDGALIEVALSNLTRFHILQSIFIMNYLKEV
jgi:hypothetical protein